MTPEKNLATVQAMYAAFGRGDVPAILEHLTDDCEWGIASASSEAPWWRPFRGKATIPEFFRLLGQEIAFTKFQPHSFCTGADHVAALVDIGANVARTGKSMETTSTHHFFFRNGRVTRFLETVDTAAELSALTSGTTTYDLQALARRYFDCLDKRDLAALERMFAPGAVFTGLAAAPLDPAGTKATMGEFFRAFPDSRMPVDGVIASSDEVAIRHRFEGTHKETFLGIPATGKRVSVTATVTLRVRKGLVTEGILHADMLGMMVQLGAVRPPGA
jgi:steroid delta-isomerase-like uncharacterized protein